MLESITNNGAILVTAVAVIAVSIVYLKLRNDRNIEKLPPMMSMSFMSFIKEYGKGQSHRLQQQHSAISTVFRLPIRLPTISFMVADPKVARILMMGDSTNDTPESDKSSRYIMLKRLTGGVHSILTKDTSDKSWESARKSVAHSFSNTNLHKLLPQMHAKLNEFIEVLDDHILKVLRHYSLVKTESATTVLIAFTF